MNTPTPNHDRQPPMSGDGLPADLTIIAALLDSLAAAERDSAPASLCGAVAAASVSHLNAGIAAAAAATLGEDREALHADGPADLEQSTFEASRPILVAAAAARPGLRLTETAKGSAAAVPVISVRPSAWRLPVMRMAAALLLGGAALSAWWVMKPAATQLTPAQLGGENIAEMSGANAEARALSALEDLDTALRFDELDALMAEADGLESSLRGGMLDESELLEQGAM